jgi:hypothetical protein
VSDGDLASVAALVEDAERPAGSDERRAVWLRALGPTPVPVR